MSRRFDRNEFPDVEVVRFDRAGFESDDSILRPAARTPEGYLRLEGFIGAPGILEYRDKLSGTRRELVGRDVLHDPASLESLKLKPITLEHPPGGQFVGPHNFRRLNVGTTTEEIEPLADGRVRFVMLIQDATAIAAIEKHGIRMVSPGYDAGYRPVRGHDAEFGDHDGRQTRRRYNHVALTLAGRSQAATFRFDSQVVEGDPSHTHLGASPVHAMIGLLLAAGVKIPADTVASVEARFDSLDDTPEKKLGAAEAALAAAETALAESVTRIDSLEAAPTDEQVAAAEKALVDYANARGEILAHPAARRFDSKEIESLSNAEIERKLAKAIDPDLADDASVADVSATIRVSRRLDTAPRRRELPAPRGLGRGADEVPVRRVDGDGKPKGYMSTVDAAFEANRARG